ncbi:MAG TPA: ATP-binding protein, partial [Flavobacterium sp.]|nr:ATP-binding protein [Flavobacterium sp.]
FYDEERIIQVVHNLISNAIKFCSETDGKIQISIHENKDNVEVKIHNNGKGVKKEDFEAIFDKFYQGDTSHAMAGNGLGLALALRVLQLNDYKIEVESEPGRGSKFTVIIPKR